MGASTGGKPTSETFEADGSLFEDLDQLGDSLEDRAQALLDADFVDAETGMSLQFGIPWEGATNACTHVANAMRICRHYGDKIMFVQGIGWHLWGPPWQHDDLGALKLIQGLGKLITAEADALSAWVAKAPDLETKAERKEAQELRYVWAKNSESKPNLEASLALAAAHNNCKAEDLDANPHLLGLPSGVLELDSFIYREHRHSDLITKTTNVDYAPQAAAPIWKRFITDIMDNDPQLIAFLQCLAGYSLLGSRGEHLLPICWGSGANGKSTFLGTLEYVLGKYANSAAPGLLIQRNTQDHPTGLADLQGRRLVIVSESGEAGKLNEEQVKLLTGGDTITARRMRQDFFTFKPTHLLFLQTNHRPKVTGTDEGIWRRLRLIPFLMTIPPERRDTKLLEKLRMEGPGILSWMVEGLRAYQTAGFSLPDKVRAATAEYRDASDQIGTFLDDCVTLGHAFSTPAGAIYARYADWCEASGDRPRSQREFGMRLAERGFERYRAGGVHRWRGLQVRESNCY